MNAIPRTIRVVTNVLFLFLLCTLASCDYPLNDEDFVVVQPPAPECPIDLNLMGEGDTLFLFNRTTLQYDFNTYGLIIRDAKIRLGSKVIELHSTQGEFVLDPDDFPPGYDTLTLTLISNSGTGSIADKVGVEGYLVEKKWIAVIDNRPPPQLDLHYSINENGFLAISWNSARQYNFRKYQLNRHGNSAYTSRHIYAVSDTVIVDSCFTGGEVNYTLGVGVQTDAQFEMVSDLEIIAPMPELNFELIDVEELRIWWNKSRYPAVYTLRNPDTSPEITYLASSTDTSVVIPFPGFGSYIRMEFTVAPRFPGNCSGSATSVKSFYYFAGEHLAPNWPHYAYSHHDKIVYTTSYDDMMAYDVQTMNLVNSLQINGLGVDYACPPNSSRVAAISSDAIHVFENSQLQNPRNISYESMAQAVDHFYLTTNNMVAVAQGSRYDLISVDSQSVVASLPIEDYPYYSKWACISTSSGAEYCSVVTYNGIWIYDIRNLDFNLVYHDTRSYRSVLFNENNPLEIYTSLRFPPVLEVRSAVDFSLVKSIDLPSVSVIRNVDPETGYMLLTDYTTLYVLDLNSGEIVLNINSTDSRPQLYNSRLFSNNGFTWDISAFLP